MGKCDRIEYKAEHCPDKPAEGIRHCHRYKMIHSGSSRRKGPRPGHTHEHKKIVGISNISLSRSIY